MSEHTPTPWHEGPTCAIHQTFERDDVVTEIVDRDGVFVACVNHPNPQHEANASYIIRAVNSHDTLVKALREVREDYRELLRHSTSNEEADEIDDMLQVVDAALATVCTCDPGGSAGCPVHDEAVHNEALGV